MPFSVTFRPLKVHYTASKHWALIISGHSIISQKDRILNNMVHCLTHYTVWSSYLLVKQGFWIFSPVQKCACLCCSELTFTLQCYFSQVVLLFSVQVGMIQTSHFYCMDYISFPNCFMNFSHLSEDNLKPRYFIFWPLCCTEILFVPAMCSFSVHFCHYGVCDSFYWRHFGLAWGCRLGCCF